MVPVMMIFPSKRADIKLAEKKRLLGQEIMPEDCTIDDFVEINLSYIVWACAGVNAKTTEINLADGSALTIEMKFSEYLEAKRKLLTSGSN